MKHGHWIDIDACMATQYGAFYSKRCSCCDKETLAFDEYEYCPHCGAKMEADNRNKEELKMKLHKILIELFNLPLKEIFNDPVKAPTIPTKGSKQAAGRDLYAYLDSEEVLISPGETRMIPLGFATSMPKSFVGLIFSRSGIVKERGLRVANGVGVIDSDYRGEWKVMIHNDSGSTQTIKNGEKIAQVVFMKYKDVVFYPIKELDKTGRGEGGFGSTGR